jgi:hypothetical protein
MTRKTLTPAIITEIRFLYEERGWNNEHLGKKFGVAHTTISRLAQRKGFVRRTIKRISVPQELSHLYKRRTKQYPEAVRQAESRKAECSHKLWSARCAHCNSIRGSNVTHVMIPRHELERVKAYSKLIEQYG